jgi:hypothetical protein
MEILEVPCEPGIEMIGCRVCGRFRGGEWMVLMRRRMEMQMECGKGVGIRM